MFCPNCDKLNHPDKLFCKHCGAELATAEHQATQTFVVALFSDTMPSEVSQKVEIFPLGEMLTLEFENQRVSVGLEHPLMLGRLPNSTLDLTPFEAQSRGVSRVHATITRDDEGYLEFMDQSSTNGSYLNGRQLEPLRPYYLKNRDRLQLGELEMRILFTPVN